MFTFSQVLELIAACLLFVEVIPRVYPFTPVGPFTPSRTVQQVFGEGQAGWERESREFVDHRVIISANPSCPYARRALAEAGGVDGLREQIYEERAGAYRRAIIIWTIGSALSAILLLIAGYFHVTDPPEPELPQREDIHSLEARARARQLARRRGDPFPE